MKHNIFCLLVIVIVCSSSARVQSTLRSPQGLAGWQAPKCNPCTATLELLPTPEASDLNSHGYRRYLIKQHETPKLAAECFNDFSYLIHITFFDTYKAQGWDRLQIVVNTHIPIPDVVKAHAAGYAEAYFTAADIYDYWNNYRTNTYGASGGQPPPELVEYIDKQVSYVRGKVAAKSGSSKYWRLMGLVLEQFEGLVEGYMQNIGSSAKNLTWHELYLLQSLGDLYDLHVLFPPASSPAQQLTAEFDSSRNRRYTPGHGMVSPEGYGELLECSALIRLYNDSDVSSSSMSDSEEPLSDMQVIRPGRLRLDKHNFHSTKTSGGSPIRSFLSRWAKYFAVMMSPVEQQHDVSMEYEPQANRPSSNMDHGVKGAIMLQSDEGGDDDGDDDDDEQLIHYKPKHFTAGHATWRPFYQMHRTWKVYVFPWSDTGPVVVSSSPGLLHSKDDWYTTDRFVVMETTNGIYNKSLYDKIVPECALTWQRAMVANFGASRAQEWIDLFAKHNSGTYNNQWMVLDVIALNAGWQRNVMWIMEQLPGYTEKADVTSVLLQQGFWSSYNVPYFQTVYNMSGYPPEQDLYHNCARAKIFTRDAQDVATLSDMKHILRYNRYQDDPLSEGKPNNAIAARYDLKPAAGYHGNWTRSAFGAVDAKVLDHHTFRKRKTHVICGPTTENQPPFKWSDANFSAIAHEGTVSSFDFEWQQYAVQDLPEILRSWAAV